jgi:predicted nuclease of predicted toxin-antitoxin system
MTVDYEEAASFFNHCRAKGIQGSNTDFLICAVAARNDFPIFTKDADFAHFAKVLPITLYGAKA